MWVSNRVATSDTYLVVLVLHQSRLYYLTVLLCSGLTFMVDLFYKGVMFNIFTSPTDFLRYLVNNKLSPKDYEGQFNAIYEPIREKYVYE